MIHAKVVRLHMVLCLIVACVGCGRGQLPTAVVEGRVLYEGKPLAFGSVMFQPVAGGPIARGIIQADGSFRLTTYKPNDGAILGEHLVRISCFENQRPAESTAPSADVDALKTHIEPRPTVFRTIELKAFDAPLADELPYQQFLLGRAPMLVLRADLPQEMRNKYLARLHERVAGVPSRLSASDDNKEVHAIVDVGVDVEVLQVADDDQVLRQMQGEV